MDRIRTNKTVLVITILLLLLSGIYYLYAANPGNKEEADKDLNKAIYIITKHLNISIMEPIGNIYTTVKTDTIDAELKGIKFREKCYKAIELLESAKENDPSIKVAYAYLGLLYSIMVDIVWAEEQRIDCNFVSRGINNIETSIDTEPYRYDLYSRLINLYRIMGATEKRKILLNKLRRNKVFPPDFIDYHYGIVCFDIGDYDKSIDLAQSMLRSNKSNYWANILLAMSYFKKDDHKSFESIFSYLLKTYPKMAPSLNEIKSHLQNNVDLFGRCK